MLLTIIPELTDRDEPERRRALATHAGMVHYAGSGPAGAWCHDCRYWANESTGNAPRAGQEEPLCQKYRSMMQGNKAPKIPGGAAACKYFDERRPE